MSQGFPESLILVKFMTCFFSEIPARLQASRKLGLGFCSTTDGSSKSTSVLGPPKVIKAHRHDDPHRCGICTLVRHCHRGDHLEKTLAQSLLTGIKLCLILAGAHGIRRSSFWSKTFQPYVKNSSFDPRSRRSQRLCELNLGQWVKFPFLKPATFFFWKEKRPPSLRVDLMPRRSMTPTILESALKAIFFVNPPRKMCAESARSPKGWTITCRPTSHFQQQKSRGILLDWYGWFYSLSKWYLNRIVAINFQSHFECEGSTA